MFNSAIFLGEVSLLIDDIEERVVVTGNYSKQTCIFSYDKWKQMNIESINIVKRREANDT